MSLSRTTRKRLLIVFCCGLLLVGGGVGAYAVRKQRVRAEYAGYRAQGLSAAKGSDNEKAIDLLGKYLRRYPEDTDVLVEYARVRPLVKSPDRAHLRDTMLVLRHLLTLHPEMAEQRRTLLRMYAEFGYASEAVATADKLLETTPDDAEILGIRATSLARMRRQAEALTAATKWAEKAPQDVDAHILVLQMMQANGKSKGEITQSVEKLKGKLTDPASFELVSGIAAAVNGSQDQAFELISKAAAHPKLDPKLARRVIGAFDSLGKYRESLAMLQRLVKETGDATAQRSLVRRLWELNQWNDVLSYPIPAGSELSADLELKGMIGTALARNGKTSDAQAIATELLAAKDPVAVAWGEALSQSVVPAKADARKLVDACQVAIKDSPGNAYLWYFLAQGYGRLGESELAIANYTKAAQQNATWAAPLVSLSDVLMSAGRQEQALAAALAGYRRSPGAAAVALAISLNANVDAGRIKDEADLQNLLKDIESNAGAAQYVLPERVASLARTGKKAEAADAIKKALAATPAINDAILPRLAAASRNHNLALEAQCYEALERQNGASASVAVSRALSAYFAGQKDEALAAFEKARRDSGKGDSVEWQVAGARLLDLARDPKAGAAWIALGDARPDELSVQEAALLANSTRSEREFVDRTIERVKKLTGGEGVQWRVARARWTLDGAAGRSQAEMRKAGEDASLLLTEVLRSAPDAIDARFLQVKALEYQDNLNAAIEQMTAVVQQNPSLPASSLYLAKLLQQRGDFAKAHDYVARATQTGLKDESSRRIAAQLLAQQGRPGEATKLLEELGGGAAAEGAADLLLATLYRQQGDLSRAEQICAQLLKKPDEAVVAFAVDLYGAMGRADDAKKAIDLLKGLNAKPGTRELLLAEFAGRYGKPADAVACCRTATQVAPKNGLTWRALVLSSLATGNAKDAWAAIEQGLKELPSDPYLKAANAARTTIEKGLADPGLRSLALALARSPETPGTADAVTVMSTAISTGNSKAQQLAQLKQIADRNPLNLPLQLFAAERFLTSGDRMDEAATIATRAAQNFPLSPEASRMAAQTLLNGKRWPEAVGFAKAWHERTPANPAEADFVGALALLKSNQAADAKSVLAPYFPRALQQADANAGLIALYAAALCNSGAGAEAEKILVPALKGSEAVRSAWLARAAEDLAVNDAVDWLGRVAAITGGDNSVASQVQIAAASAALAQKGGNEKLLASARELRAKMIARQDLSIQAMAVLASQAEQDQDFATAESLYRRVLQADRSLAVIKNNLAMVLVNQGRKQDLAEATSLASDAVQSNPGVANFYDTLAQVQVKAGETDKAADTLRKAAAIDPDHLDWQVNLVQVLLGAGRSSEAAKAMADLDAAAGKQRKLSDDLRAKIAAVRQRVAELKGSAVSSGRS